MRRVNRILKRVLPFVLPLVLLSGCYVSGHDGCGSCGVSGTLVVHNAETAYGEIWYAYTAPSSSDTWGEELLQDAVLYPGDDLIVDMYSCDRYYDIRVEYDHGLVIEKEGIWLPCDAVTHVTFSD